MKVMLLALALLPASAHLAHATLNESYATRTRNPQAVAQRFEDLIPFGAVDGHTSNGEACRVIYSSMPSVDPELIEYIRVQVINYDRNDLVDVEIFFDDLEAPVEARAGDRAAKAVYKRKLLSAIYSGYQDRYVLVTADDMRNHKSMSCIVARDL